MWHTPTRRRWPRSSAPYAHWQGREAYRVRSFVCGLLYIAIGIDVMRYVSTGTTGLLWLWGGLWLAWQGRYLLTRGIRHWWRGRRGLLCVLPLLVAGLLSGGCALWFQHTHPPISRTLDVADPPDATYARAMRVTMEMGGTLWQQDARSRTLQAFLEAKVSLTIQVEPRAGGSRLYVTHQNLPTYFTRGDDGTLSEQFLARYTHYATRR